MVHGTTIGGFNFYHPFIFSCPDRTIEASINLFGPVNNEEAQGSSNYAEYRQNKRVTKKQAGPSHFSGSSANKLMLRSDNNADI